MLELLDDIANMFEVDFLNDAESVVSEELEMDYDADSEDNGVENNRIKKRLR